MLSRNSSLTSLGLSKHALVDSGLDTLVTYGLLRNSGLKSIDLSANKLSPFAGMGVRVCAPARAQEVRVCPPIAHSSSPSPPPPAGLTLERLLNDNRQLAAINLAHNQV